MPELDGRRRTTFLAKLCLDDSEHGQRQRWATSMNHMTFVGRVIVALVGAVLVGSSAHRATAQSSVAYAGPVKILGDESSYLDFGAGAFNIQGHRGSDPAGAGDIELHYGRKLFFLGLAAGLLADTKGGLFGYGGVYSDFTYRHFVVTPLAAIGGYRKDGSSIDLGGPFQFRLSLTGAYEFDGGSRLGLRVAHISNAGIHKRNPGENELLLTYSVPLQLPF